jgi:hypothetical protein
MSVLKNKRNTSKLELYHNARKMRKELILLLRRDFGIHGRGNAKKIDPSLPDDYFDEDIADFRRNIKILLRNLIWNVTAGNTIFPKNEKEVEKRRTYQTRAIINCERLHQEFLCAEDVLPLQISKLIPYVEMIETEIKLLKGWRKANNKIMKQTNERGGLNANK